MATSKLPVAVPGSTYAERAAQIIQLFVGADIAPATVLRLCNEAYATFAHPAVVPLVQVNHHDFVQELFHGPTLAFKDVALQLVGRMFDEVLREQGRHQARESGPHNDDIGIHEPTLARMPPSRPASPADSSHPRRQ